MMELLVATNNAHKLDEYKEIFAELPLNVTSLADEGISLDPEETGGTFAEHAVLTANAFAQVSEKLVLADDSGLEVDALGGEPGVHSARYANTARDDHVGRYQIVLDRLAATPDGDGTLLDHAMVMYGSGLADGNRHAHHDLPILLTGNACGTIKPARHIRYPQDTPLANLYLGMLHRLGDEADSFSDSTGPLEGLS